MKKLLFFLLLPLSLQAFQKTGKTPESTTGTVTLVCKIIGAPASAQYISLSEPLGLAFREVARGMRQPDSSFLLTIPVSKPQLYTVGFNESSSCRIILGEEPQITLWANAQYMELGRTIGSPTNQAYLNLNKRIEALNTKSDALRVTFRQARYARNQTDVHAVSEQLTAIEKEKEQLLDSLKAVNPILWRTASLRLTPEYTGNDQDKQGYSGELEYYSNEFFAFANLNDPAYELSPEVSDAFQKYVLTISQLGGSTTTCKQLIETQLAKLTPGTKTYRRALSGVIDGLKTANHPDYVTYVKKYMDTYRSSDMGEIARLDYELKRNSTFTPGMEAPDLAGRTPEGPDFALSKLRGKYVLVDFWASWCGPCRRENPNVKAMYEKYKDKGFDILGVSLDRDEGAWKKAIEQDGLVWHHISDLKGWSSEHAKLYSVSSIPQTLLLDREGKIVQRNLRGEQLGEKLKEIFGE